MIERGVKRVEKSRSSLDKQEDAIKTLEKNLASTMEKRIWRNLHHLKKAGVVNTQTLRTYMEKACNALRMGNIPNAEYYMRLFFVELHKDEVAIAKDKKAIIQHVGKLEQQKEKLAQRLEEAKKAA